MTQAQTGDTVRVHYTGKLAEGEVFDSSLERDPIEFTLGEGQMIEGFEDAVTGMSPGDSKTFEIPSEEAYGPHDDQLVMEIDRQQIPDHIEPEIGDQLRIQQADGESFSVTITAISDASVTLDANHPLAGQDLTFDIQLVEIA